MYISKYSPRVWRWSSYVVLISNVGFVFSTSVEVILMHSIMWVQRYCILHECGGDPFFWAFWSLLLKYSPRVWRWSLTELLKTLSSTVFSTSVEVIPFAKSINTVGTGYSPRVWRWSLGSKLMIIISPVFSTSVEVIPRWTGINHFYT